MRYLDKENVIDMLWGGTFLGAGGGGSPLPGLKELEGLFGEIDKIELVEPEEVEDSSSVIMSSQMGSPEVLLKEGLKRQHIYAFERAEEHFGSIDYILSAEIGGNNLFAPIQTAGVKHKKFIDGDGAGRAIPELQQCTFAIDGINSCPLFIADSKRNYAVINANDTEVAESMSRAITSSFGMRAGVASTYMTGMQLKKSILPGTVTLAERVGRVIRETKEANGDVIRAVTREIDGRLLATGVVSKKTVEVRGGFDFGRICVGEIVVDYKNESMIAWKNDKPIAMVPDSICWITTDGTPLTNSSLMEGLDVAVIAMKAHSKFRTKEAYDTFRHILTMLGYREDFRGVEDLI